MARAFSTSSVSLMVRGDGDITSATDIWSSCENPFSAWTISSRATIPAISPAAVTGTALKLFTSMTSATLVMLSFTSTLGGVTIRFSTMVVRGRLFRLMKMS